MDLQPLFPEPILEQRELTPGYSGHASDLWLVRTRSELVVVRASRLTAEPSNDFWWGCRQLFGIDPRRIFDLAPLNELLRRTGGIPVPRVLRQGHVSGRACVVVECMPGQALTTFLGQPAAMLAGLGEGLARIHARPFASMGSPTGTAHFGCEEFHVHMIQVMRELAARFHSVDPAFCKALDPICALAAGLPLPASGALIMVDMDPTQYLADGERITALVDTEAHAIGPRELDFIALEYLLDQEGAHALSRGYARVLPLPDLTRVRPVYRFLYRLMSVQGQAPLAEWLDWPTCF